MWQIVVKCYIMPLPPLTIYTDWFTLFRNKKLWHRFSPELHNFLILLSKIFFWKKSVKQRIILILLAYNPLKYKYITNISSIKYQILNRKRNNLLLVPLQGVCQQNIFSLFVSASTKGIHSTTLHNLLQSVGESLRKLQASVQAT